MTLFVFQIKNVGSDEFDNIKLYNDFNRLKSAFDGKVESFRDCGFTEVKCNEPVFVKESESDDEYIAGGQFEFLDGNRRFVGKVHPYWIY